MKLSAAQAAILHLIEQWAYAAIGSAILVGVATITATSAGTQVNWSLLLPLVLGAFATSFLQSVGVYAKQVNNPALAAAVNEAEQVVVRLDPAAGLNEPKVPVQTLTPADVPATQAATAPAA